MNPTYTSQMTHQNPLHHQPPLMESDKTNKIDQISSSSSSSSSSATNEQSEDQTSLHVEASDSVKEQTMEPMTRFISEASDSDKKESLSSTDLQQQQQQQEHEESENSGDEDGRERLKRHRREVAGNVWIPEIWGQEELLKDWIDCSTFDSCLVPSGISSARAALVQEARRASSNGGLRSDSRCLISR